MLPKGPAKKVTIFLNEDTQHHMGPLYESILTFLMHKGVAGATASRAMAGFGAHHEMHTTKIEVLTQHLPVRVEFIETAEKVEELLPTLYDMVSDGLIEVHDIIIVKSAMKEKHKTEPKRPHEEKRGTGKLMRIFMGEGDRWHGEPLYDAVVKRLRMMDIAGATVYRGILGYGAKGHKHQQSFFHMAHDLPVMVAVVDTEEKLLKATEAVEEMLEDGLIVLSDVDIIRLLHGRPAAEVSDARPAL
jgi:PII-like signaling protein